MALTNFVDRATVIAAAWLNKLDVLYVTVFDEATTKAGAKTALGITSTGDSIITAASAAAARTVLGSTSTGDALFTTASAAAARTTLGATSTGDAVFIAASASAARTAIGLEYLEGSVTLDPPNLAPVGTGNTTVTVTGAALGDYAIASFSLDTQGVLFTANVTSADTVTVYYVNYNGGFLDLGSGTLKVRVWK